MYCKNCGSKMSSSDTFCTECGTKVFDGNLVKIKVTRKKKVMGFAIPFPLYIDGEKIGQLKNGDTIEKEVVAGKHLVEFVCADGNVKQEIDLTNSKEVEILCCSRMGLIAATVGILEVNYKN